MEGGGVEGQMVWSRATRLQGPDSEGCAHSPYSEHRFPASSPCGMSYTSAWSLHPATAPTPSHHQTLPPSVLPTAAATGLIARQHPGERGFLARFRPRPLGAGTRWQQLCAVVSFQWTLHAYIFYAMVWQISMLFIDNTDSVFCTGSLVWPGGSFGCLQSPPTPTFSSLSLTDRQTHRPMQTTHTHTHTHTHYTYTHTHTQREYSV